ncbi:MAG: PASTA domain-containing protein [Saprospiraceae bacterium]|nr:PASTA domain-containing protein [Saprospiraceae bacterium]
MSFEQIEDPNKKRNFFVELGYFLSSRYLLKHLFLIIGSFVALILLIFWFLGVYTNHGDSREVPDLVNRPVKDLGIFMKANGLRYAISEERWIDGKQPGVVLEQDPVAGSRVKENRMIYLTVSAIEPPSVKLFYNSFIGLTYENVSKKIKALGLKVGDTKTIKGKGANTVARVSCNGDILFREMDPSKYERKPTEARLVPKGSKIDLVIYQEIDASPKRIPMLQCSAFGEAEVVIKSHQFVMGNVNIVGEITDTVNAFVWKQDPPAGSEAIMGTPIKLWLTKDFPEPCNEEEYVPSSPELNNENTNNTEDEDDEELGG